MQTNTRDETYESDSASYYEDTDYGYTAHMPHEDDTDTFVDDDDYLESYDADDVVDVGSSRGWHLLLIVVLCVLIALFVMFVALPFLQSLMQAPTPDLPPAIQT